MPGIIFSEASGVADSIYGKAQAPIQEIVLSTAKTREETESAYKRIFKMTRSTHYAETYGGVTGFKGFRPTPENGANNRDGMQETFGKTLKNIRWTDEFVVSHEMVEDALVMEFNERPQGFVDGFYDAREDYAAALIGGALMGKTEIDFYGQKCDITSADGLSLFNAAHPSVINSSNVQSNVCSNVLSAEALDLVETAHQNLRDDHMKSLQIAPMTLVIPNTAQAKRIAFAAAGSERDPLTSNNAFNYQVGRWNILVWQRLNDYITTDGEQFPWFTLDEVYNQRFSTAIFQDRSDLKIRSHIDESNWSNVWSGIARFVAGFKDFRGVFAGGVTGAAALV
ncbi:MAG: hypothetical protein IJ017_04560 [Oscillospiraceae bacterium]|nr:hypothetical protein [Oscillospiraceae bacterium]